MTAAATVFMFSGQGSHYYQMGRELFDREPLFKKRMLELDELVRQLSGGSVVQSLYLDGRGKADPCARTTLTHPAILMVELSLAELLMERGVIPDLVLGCSLGTFAAATVAGMVGAEQALTAVVRQAALLEESCEAGGMIAVLADPAIHTENFFAERCELAAINFKSHFVVAAPQAHLPELEAHLKHRGLMYQRLPVSFAFHSRWIDAAREPFERCMKTLAAGTARLPMMCSERVRQFTSLPPDYFWGVVRNPIHFAGAIAALERAGTWRYIDVGPAGTLSTFLKYLLPESSASTTHLVLNPFGQEHRNLMALQPAVEPLRSVRLH